MHFVTSGRAWSHVLSLPPRRADSVLVRPREKGILHSEQSHCYGSMINILVAKLVANVSVRGRSLRIP